MRGDWYIGSYQRITGEQVPEWIIGMLVPSSMVAVAARVNLLWSVVSGLICLGVAVLLALWLSSKMARPLQALSEEARRIGQLDLGTSITRKSRMEGLNRDFGTRILISDGTRKASGAALVVRPVARVVVKGRSHGVLAYELMGLEVSEHPQGQELAARTESAFRTLEERRFDEAERLYREILSVYPEDGVAKLNAERCLRLQARATSSDSDTLFHARSK